MKITSAAEMREIDRITTEKFGVPSLDLMEHAGTAVADFTLRHYPNAKTIGVICGKGNNGGDGFVAARKLREAGKQVRVLLLAEPTELRGDAAEKFERMQIEPAVALNAEELRERGGCALGSDLLLDAILGTGFRPPVSGLYADAIAAMNSSGTPVVAVDIPSGADADAMSPNTESLRARADAVVTFTAPRPAHVLAELTTGETQITLIGSPEEAIVSSLGLNLITPRDFSEFLAPRQPEGQKGIYGHALIVGGSFGKSGAAAMAGVACLRSGVGLATVATPRSVLPTVAGYAPELMTEPVAESDSGTITAEAVAQLEPLLKAMNVVALGPGISRNPETVSFVHQFVPQCPKPLVIDADGLNAFAGDTAPLNGSKRILVLTPHPGEMARLTGKTVKEVQADRIGVARNFAKQHQCVLVLKGHRTLVALPDGTVWVNVTGNPGMATGGAGDVLTGITAGLLAQAQAMKSPDANVKAVIAAVYLHGLAGDVARERMGEPSLIATDIIEGLPEAFRRAQQQLPANSFSFHG
jgi:ADP-dependent NAD(P)H-hydrate dehydratase / NAD(P)H-hydrate epimerase